VRFTPDTSRSLIGPGVGRRTAWVELATPLSLEHREAFVEAEAILLDHGGRPHPGKKTMCTAEDLRARHGERFERFDRVRREVDPEGRLLNPLARRLFVPSGA
jgi:L-gulonolactone oxidase